MAKSTTTTTIEGPPRTYKTQMLILVANEEARKGKSVVFSSADDREESLRRRGLVDAVHFAQLEADHADGLGRVVSADSATSETRIWRVRQVRLAVDHD